MRSKLFSSLLSVFALSVAACDGQPDQIDDERFLRADPLQDEPTPSPSGSGDVYVNADEQLLDEKFDPNALYVEVDSDISALVVSRAKNLTQDYKNLVAPKTRAMSVQRLVRDSLSADTLVVAKVIEVEQEQRPGPDDTTLPWTVYTFEVNTTLWSKTQITEFTLENLGGTTDGAVVHACGKPDFSDGFNYLLALANFGEHDAMSLVNIEAAWPLAGNVIDDTDVTVAALQAELLEVMK